VRLVRSNGSELDGVVHHCSLERSAEELAASISLDTLNGKLFEHMFLEEPHGIMCSATRVERQHSQSGVIVNGSELEQSGCDLDCVNLHSLTGHITAVRLRLSGSATAT